MPWHREPMKDAASCDNPRRGAHILRPGGSPNGRTHPQRCGYPRPEHIGPGRTTRELKHLSTRRRGNQSRDSPSSGERKGTDGQTVERAYPAGVPPTGLKGRASGGCRPRAQVRLGSGTAWEGRPQRVTAPYANPDRTSATRSLSRAGHVKPGPNLGGPPSKPEYYPVTDSAPVP